MWNELADLRFYHQEPGLRLWLSWPTEAKVWTWFKTSNILLLSTTSTSKQSKLWVRIWKWIVLFLDQAHWQSSGKGVCHCTVQAVQLWTFILCALFRIKLNCMFCPQEDGFLLVPQHTEIKVCWEYKWGLVSSSGLSAGTSGPDRRGTATLSFSKITNTTKCMGAFQ